jgi:ribonuclease-3
LEAFVGAVYLDKGFAAAQKFVEEKILKPHIDLEEMIRQEMNFKSRLLEWCQKRHVKLEFELLRTFFDHRNRMFECRALLNEVPAGLGSGISKKASEQQAARRALKRLERDKAFRHEVTTALHKEAC